MCVLYTFLCDIEPILKRILGGYMPPTCRKDNTRNMRLLSSIPNMSLKNRRLYVDLVSNIYIRVVKNKKISKNVIIDLVKDEKLFDVLVGITYLLSRRTWICEKIHNEKFIKNANPLYVLINVLRKKILKNSPVKMYTVIKACGIYTNIGKSRRTNDSRFSDRLNNILKDNSLLKQILGTIMTEIPVRRIKNSIRGDIVNRWINPDANWAWRTATMTILCNTLGRMTYGELVMFTDIILLCLDPGIHPPNTKKRFMNMCGLRYLDYFLKEIHDEKEKEILRIIYTRRLEEFGRDSDILYFLKRLSEARQARIRNAIIQVNKPRCTCHTKCDGCGEKGNKENGRLFAKILKKTIFRWNYGSVICSLCRISQEIDNTTSKKSKTLIQGMNPICAACSVDGCTSWFFLPFYKLTKKAYTHVFFTTNAFPVLTSVMLTSKPSTSGRFFGICFGGSRTCGVKIYKNFPERKTGIKEPDFIEEHRDWERYESPYSAIDTIGFWRCSTCSLRKIDEDTIFPWRYYKHKDTCVDTVLSRLYRKEDSWIENIIYLELYKYMCTGCIASILCHHFNCERLYTLNSKEKIYKTIKFICIVKKAARKIWKIVP